MKKLVILALALFLALPVLGHAGTVTDSKNWDLVIGGYIAGIVQFSDNNDSTVWGAVSPYTPTARTGNVENRSDKWGNFAVNSDVRVGFRILGPDTWGAKSSAYLEWDFAGGTVSTVAAGTGSNGTAKIRHAWMRWDWAKDGIMFGNTTALYRDVAIGLPPGLSTLIAEPVVWGGPRGFQLRWDHKWTKELVTKLSADWGAQDKWLGAGPSDAAPAFQQDYTRTNLPFLTGQVRYATDSCGKVGPLNLAVAANAVIGQRAYGRVNAAGARPNSQSHGYGWLGNLSVQIPIIPEKANNKAMGLVFIPQIEVTQNLPIGLAPGSFTTGAFTTATASADDYSNPRAYLLQGTVYFYLTDTVFANFTYGLNRTQFSDKLSAAQIQRKQYYLLALMYQPNPSLSAGIEYARYIADYQTRSVAPVSKHRGTANAVRFGAYYYF